MYPSAVSSGIPRPQSRIRAAAFSGDSFDLCELHDTFTWEVPQIVVHLCATPELMHS